MNCELPATGSAGLVTLLVAAGLAVVGAAVVVAGRRVPRSIVAIVAALAITTGVVAFSTAADAASDCAAAPSDSSAPPTSVAHDSEIVESSVAPVTTAAPATDPPATDPPATDPPATDPSATDPAATDPPATDPPATDPPATDPVDNAWLRISNRWVDCTFVSCWGTLEGGDLLPGGEIIVYFSQEGEQRQRSYTVGDDGGVYVGWMFICGIGYESAYAVAPTAAGGTIRSNTAFEDRC